jgi:Mn2+/Fe2+ NRAMP family transporter
MTRRIFSILLALLLAASLFSGVVGTVSAANVNTGFTPASPGSYGTFPLWPQATRS